ncbi:MAG: class I SAM-dependent methyltransferase [Proteobacteria bacterium]|nr:MAG: class I SAM-dependent methyltransferase [Pseudomonadota bacterium]
MIAASTDRQYFQKLYEASVDPFHNWRNEYEDSKRAQALSLLQKAFYPTAFEPGCGNGALSLDLSERCGHLSSVDWSSDALRAASLHCAGVANIDFSEMDFPAALPQKTFDLLIVSELLYYFSEMRLKKFFHSIPEIVKPGGEVMLIHWRGASDDYPSTGDAVHEEFHKLTSIRQAQVFEHPQYLISSGIVLCS